MRNSTLFSFGFAKYDYIPPVVLNLFDGYENTTVNGEPVLNYILEVYEAVLDGRIDLKHHFNMIGYIKTIQENNKCTESKKAKKVKRRKLKKEVMNNVLFRRRAFFCTT